MSLISKIHRVCFKHSNPPALRKHTNIHIHAHTGHRALFEHLFIVALCQSTTYLARSMSFFPLLTVDLFIFPFLTKFFYFDPLCIFICEKHTLSKLYVKTCQTTKLFWLPKVHILHKLKSTLLNRIHIRAINESISYSLSEFTSYP